MKVEIRLNDEATEPKIVIETAEINDEIKELVTKLKSIKPLVIVGFKDDKGEILNLKEIFRIYSEDGKTIAECEKGNFSIKQRLYEVEEKLVGTKFVRISNSEIINLSKVKGFDLSFSGTICVELQNGCITYVSRRYVGKIKQVLDL